MDVTIRRERGEGEPPQTGVPTFVCAKSECFRPVYIDRPTDLYPGSIYRIDRPPMIIASINGIRIRGRGRDTAYRAQTKRLGAPFLVRVLRLQ